MLWAIASSRALIAALIVAGAALRLWQYLANASMGVDEAALARNIIDRPVLELFGRLDFGQVAPPAFLLVEKLAVLLLGSTERVLRLVPLACGLGSLVIFDAVANRVVSGPTRTFAVALFSLGVPFVYYSSQVKQYAGDVAASLVVLLLALQLVERDPTGRRALWTAAAGAILPWCSQTAVFMLAGAGIVLFVHAVRRPRLRRQIVGVVLLWGVSAGAAVVVAITNMAPQDSAFVYRFWAAGFMPLHSPVDTGAWLWNALVGAFSSFSNAPPTLDGGMQFRRPWVFAGLSLLGGVALWRRHPHRAALLLAPIGVTLAASAAALYPFAGRAALFLVPSLLILAAAGAEALALLAHRLVGRAKVPVFATLTVFAALAVFPLHAIAAHLPPDWQEDFRPVVEHVARHRQPGDVVHVYYGAGQMFRYYAPRMAFADGEYSVGRCAMDEPRAYLAEVDRFRGRARVWVIFSHSLQGGREIRLITGYLDAIGRRLSAVPAHAMSTPLSARAYAFLYDLSGPPPVAVTPASFPVAADWNNRTRAWLCYGPMTP